MSPSRGEAAQERALLPPRWLLFAAVPLLPFVGAAAALQFVAPPPLDPAAYAGAFQKGPAALTAHFGDRLSYATLVYLQLVACLAVLGYYGLCLRELDPARRRGAVRVLAATVGFALLAMAPVRALGSAAYAVTFQNIRDLLQQAAVTQDFTLPAYRLAGIEFTPIAIVSGLAFLLGILAVIAAVPVAAATATFAPGADAAWQARFAERMRLLQHAFYALSIVLVTSTLALMLFFQLPAALASGAEQLGLQRYARGLTVFWGATMTMTLMAVFVPPLLALRAAARARHRAAGLSQDFDRWLAEHAPLSVQRQLANLAAMLGPIMVGPLGTVVQSVFQT
jgi:hypothetical protein